MKQPSNWMWKGPIDCKEVCEGLKICLGNNHFWVETLLVQLLGFPFRTRPILKLKNLEAENPLSFFRQKLIYFSVVCLTHFFFSCLFCLLCNQLHDWHCFCIRSFIVSIRSTYITRICFSFEKKLTSFPVQYQPTCLQSVSWALANIFSDVCSGKSWCLLIPSQEFQGTFEIV